MAGEDSVLVPGANITPTFGAAASVIEQAIMLATPNEYRGMVIRDNTPPLVTGEPPSYPANWYSFQIRSLWINDNGEAHFHNGTTWEYIRARPAFNSVTNDMIEDGSLMIGKLSSFGGGLNQLIRVRAAGGFEYVDAINTISPDTLPVDRLAGPATAVVSVLQSVSSVKSWVTFNSAFITGALSDNSVPVNKLVRGSALQVPMVAADGNSVVWNAVLSGIPDGAINLGKLATSVGDAGKFLKYDAAGKVVPADAGVVGTNAALANGDKIVAITTAGTTKNAPFGKYDSGLIAFTGVANYRANHSLGVTPSLAQAWLECVTPEHGYVAGDRVAIYGFDWQSGNDQRPHFQFMVNATEWSVTVIDNDLTLSTMLIYDKGSGHEHFITIANWRLRVILHNF